MAASIIAIGNPGAGKSTILNCLAGKLLFKAGVNIGTGLTYQMDKRVNEKGTFYDTPGLADMEKREEASKAISTALRKGGPFKILFFVRQQAGRIIREDMTTFKLVLASAPEIGSKYGLVINKVSKNVAERLKDPKTAEKLLTTLFASVPNKENICSATSITFLPQIEEADDVDDHLLDLETLTTLDGSPFADFVYGEVETVQLTLNKAKDIKIENFEEEEIRLEVLEKEMGSSTEIFLKYQKLMLDKMEKAEADRKEQQARETEMFTKQMELLTGKIEKKQEEVDAARTDASRAQQLQIEQQQLQLELRAQEHQKEKAELAKFRNRDWDKKKRPLLWRFYKTSDGPASSKTASGNKLGQRLSGSSVQRRGNKNSPPPPPQTDWNLMDQFDIGRRATEATKSAATAGATAFNALQSRTEQIKQSNTRQSECILVKMQPLQERGQPHQIEESKVQSGEDSSTRWGT